MTSFTRVSVNKNAGVSQTGLKTSVAGSGMPENEMSMGEVGRQVQALWKKFEGIQKAVESHALELVATRSDLRRYAEEVARYMTTGAPRCVAQNAKIESLLATQKEVVTKVNGGVGKSSVCSSHHDMICSLKDNQKAIEAQLNAHVEADRLRFENIAKENTRTQIRIASIMGAVLFLAFILQVLGPSFFPNFFQSPYQPHKSAVEKMLKDNKEFQRGLIDALTEGGGDANP